MNRRTIVAAARRSKSPAVPSNPARPAPIANARAAAGVTVHHNFQAGHSWTLLGGTTGNLNDAAAQPFGAYSQCAWFQGNGNNTVVGLRRTGFPTVDLTGRDIGLLLRVDEPNQAAQTGAQFLLYMGNSAFANFMTFSMASDSPYKVFPRRNSSGSAFGGSWQYFTFPIDTAVSLASYESLSGAQTAVQVMANVTDWQVYHRDVNPSTPARISVQEIFSLPKQTTYPNGVCVMTFDDGFASALTKAAPIVTAGGGRCSLYVIKDALGTGGYLTLADLNTLKTTHSWSISSHAFAGTVHVSPGYPKETPAAGVADLKAMRKWLLQNGFAGYNHMAYPNGAFCRADTDIVSLADDSVDLVLAPYLKTARTIINGIPETIPPGDAMKLRTNPATSGVTTLAQVQAFADIAKRTKSAMVVVFHEIVDTGPLTSTQWLTADFQSLVTYLGSIGMPIRTTDEVFGVL